MRAASSFARTKVHEYIRATKFRRARAAHHGVSRNRITDIFKTIIDYSQGRFCYLGNEALVVFERGLSLHPATLLNGGDQCDLMSVILD